MRNRITEEKARKVAGGYLAAHPGRLALLAGDRPGRGRRHYRGGILAGLPAAAILKLAQNVIIWKGL